MQVYGNENGWQYLTSSYKGALLFDGVAVVKTLNQAGVGLCLHRDEHCKAHIPSMRIFEIAASGAIAICDEHPFIQENFGDSVLYLSSNLNTDERLQQISEHLRWIKNNPKKALEMSREAHRIFVDNFSLEKLLLGLLPYHKQLIEKKGFTAREVADGTTITIVEDGSPVARLVPTTDERRRDVNEVIEDIRAFRRRERLSLGDASIRELVEEGRRW